jgi:hypothetical protein
LAGAVSDGQTAEFAPLSYDRSVDRLTLVAGTAPTENCSVKLHLDDEAQAQVFTLPAGQKRLAIALTAALAVDAEAVLAAVVLANGSVLDLAVWIESVTGPQAGTDENWVILTAGMLQSRIAAPEYNLFTSSAIQGGQSDPVPQILADISQQVRAAIRSGNQVALGPAGTIPASTKNAALTLAKWEVYARVPTLRTFLETLRPEKDAAERYLMKLAEGAITPETPSTPDEDDAPHAANWGSDTQVEL